MPRVFLQPAGGKAASEHFHDTVLAPVPLRRCAQFISALDIAELAASYGKNGARIWGVTPGAGLRNKTKWEKMSAGDAALFCGDGRAFAYGFVTHKVHSRELALDLWGEDEEEQTWEYIYFVTRPFALDASYHRLAEILDFSSDFVVLGFMGLDEKQSEMVWRELSLAND